ncbi:hypothetical protein [Thalassotalea atypica]|uniref:hypothetical protein n=1 Tax=Thalassotalea atypica TaxID=2054316 RepID=UPI002572D155|nr:hypothetical protein [Thalassotalea atypica]
MNNLQKKAVAAVLMVSSMAAVSTSVQAQEASVERVLAQVVFNQGKQVMSELSVQLQQNIKQELSRFSIDTSASWLSTPAVLVSQSKKTEQVLTTPKSSEE